MLGSIGMPELLIVLVGGLVIIWPATKICAKAGYSPWLGILVVIPIANVVLLWFLALAEWPARPTA